MVERKILPERHRGQSWRRMLLNADGWERGKDTMLVDGLETGGQSYVIGGSRTITPAIKAHRSAITVRCHLAP
jgi:hypothetical protein